jgi:PAS domain S-box-containing protein
MAALEASGARSQQLLERLQRAEDERHYSQLQRRWMAELVPLAITYVTADGRHEFCNRAFEILCGFPERPIEGRSIHEVLDPAVLAAMREQIDAALEGERTRFEGDIRFPGAGLRCVSAIFAPDRAADGTVHGFCAVIDDRTDLEQARRRLREASAQAALAEQRERRALAADLHDDVGQLLALASIKLREYEKGVGERGNSTAALQEIAGLTRTSQRRISSLSFELSPPLLHDVGFLAAVEWLAENLERTYGLVVEIAAKGEIPVLDDAAQISLFRAARELLINAAKHSGARLARVEVTGQPDRITVTIEDRGVGFVPDVQPPGFGLGNVLVRIESLGGTVDLKSSPGQGTVVSLRVPVGTASHS